MDCLAELLSGSYECNDLDEDTDSGLEESILSSFSVEGSDVATQTFGTSQFRRSNVNYDEDYDLTYEDDLKDNDYSPHRTGHNSKKDKGQHSKQPPHTGRGGYTRIMRTPEKVNSGSEADSCSSSLRHYARKDRSPQTIRKMMEKHRESERLRHHTLNESMKDVCMRVPGYDPNVKETKVIQMQRVIAYECFLENTLMSLGTQLGLMPKLLRTTTSFITDAMKETPIEEFYRPSLYKTSDYEDCDEDREGSNDQHSFKAKYKKTSYFECPNSKYHRHKISSPTIDSTTDNVIKLYPLSQSPGGSMLTLSQDSLGHIHGFVPIESSQVLFSSQESKFQDDAHEEITFQELDSLMVHGLTGGRDNDDATPSFMKEEAGSSPIYDDSTEFSFSSPGWTSSNPYIYSPTAVEGLHTTNSRYGNNGDTPSGKEMHSVAPDNILKTTPSRSSLQESFHLPCSSTPSNSFSEVIYPSIAGNSTILSRSFSDDYVPSSSSDQHLISFEEYNNMLLSNVENKNRGKILQGSGRYQPGTYLQKNAASFNHFERSMGDFIGCEKNKRKQYTPVKSSSCIQPSKHCREDCSERSPPCKKMKQNSAGKGKKNR